nr:peptidoglycan-binding protein [Amphibacillus sp. MSJ-3]
MLFIFHFSTQTIKANENEESSEDVTEEVDKSNSEEEYLDDSNEETTINEEETTTEVDTSTNDLAEESSNNDEDQINEDNNKSTDTLSINSKSDDRVEELNKKLKTLGFTTTDKLETTIKEFQSYYGFDKVSDLDKVLKQVDSVLDTPFKSGGRHKKVIQLKENLVALEFGDFVFNENYGSKTKKVVKEFQKYYGLKVNGIADNPTLALLDSILDTPLKLGGRDESVTQLKKDLVTLGFGDFNFNKNYGSSTEATVREFQKFYDLKAHGVVDHYTQDKLTSLLETPMQRGDYRKDVIILKEKLAKLGFVVSSNPTPQYGPATERTVKEFQEYYGLSKVSGVADQATISKLDELVSTHLQKGNLHDDVVLLKEKLEKLGFGNFSGNRNFGSATEKAVEDLQKYYGLRVNGIVDDRTSTKIDQVLNSPLRKGQSNDDVVTLKENLERLGFGSFSGNKNYGSATQAAVEEFQTYYGLRINGIADERTLSEIEKILNSPLREGQVHKDVIQLKKDLDKLGFGNFSFNKNYFSTTAKVVGEFQEHYGLKVNQIADQPTLDKIQSILKSHLRKGQKNKDVIQLKKDLVKIGFGDFKFNNSFGSTTESVVKEFQEAYGLPVSGIVDEVTLALIKDLAKSIRYTNYNLTLNEALNIQMKATPQTDLKYAYVSTDYVSKSGKVTVSSTGSLNVRSGPRTSSNVIGNLKQGDKVNIISEVNGWYQIEHSSSGWRDAARSDVKYYLNPSNFQNNEKQMFQFLDLSRLSGANASLLNGYLRGKGILNGMGQAFIDAGRIHGVNDVYLLSHALLETGHGNSQLARGVKINGKTVYNMFGIGAVDSCPVECGAQRAYDEGWFTPEAAIIGGAQFIGNNYVKSGQNTLYKMRWNPDAMAKKGSASHQYATDIGWASKQVNSIYNLYNDIGVNTYFFDIPEYLK